MSWLARLVETYDNHLGTVGQFETNRNGREYALIPIFHMTQNAQITVTLSPDGQFLRAEVVEKDEASTIIPCTEKSSSRTSAPVPHPLGDKLMYVAGDYPQYCQPPRGTPHADYLAQLRAWCASPHAHPKVQSVYSYLTQETLMYDLIYGSSPVLWVDDHGHLLDRWPIQQDQKKPRIFDVVASNQTPADAFVRFSVEVPGDLEPRLWRDRSVHESFIRYSRQIAGDEDLCYVTGEYRARADKHAAQIRHAADRAKLISANDAQGFTFRGRFRSSREAAVISQEVSQKGHNALKWLIARQGSTVIGGRVFVVWGTDHLDVPEPFAGSFDLYGDPEKENNEGGFGGDRTHQEFARQIRKALNGYRYDPHYHSRVMIMALDHATTGRLAIVYYRELERDPFLDRLQHWHESCAWQHRYRKDADHRLVSFWGAPATRDIAFAAYGPEASDKLVKGLLERLLPCIVDAQPIPRDIVRSAVYRVSNPEGMKNRWAWDKTLSVTCALVNKMHEQEGFDVALDEQNTTRDYLFGRLLAIADVLEHAALQESQEKRVSNALRYMTVFAQHPAKTWGIIQTALQPYQMKLGPRAIYYSRLIDQVGSLLKPEDFTNRPLGEVYLLGFYSQRYALYTKKTRTNDSQEPGASEQDQSEEETDS